MTLTVERRAELRAEGRARYDCHVARLMATGEAEVYCSYGPQEVIRVQVLSVDPYREDIGGGSGWYGADVRMPNGRKDRFPLSMLSPVAS